MKKRIITIFAFLVILIIGIIAYNIIHSGTTPAQLHIESGNVLLNGKIVSGDAKLKEADTIETKEGKASVILYESIVISLETDTEITIKELLRQHPKIEQIKGSTWNSFTALIGIETYSISTSASVATVRGTAFNFEKEKLTVDEGIVDYELDGIKNSVGEKTVSEKQAGKVITRNIGEKEKQIILKNRERTIEALRHLRSLEIEKHSIIKEQIKKAYRFSDEDIQKYLEDADNGLIDLRALAEQSPFKIGSVEKIVKITEKIKEIKSLK